MAQIYFSKFNINSEIYDVYSDESLKDKILDDVLNSIGSDLMHYEDDNTELEKDSIIKYKFCNLEKNYEDRSVTGRLVKIYRGEIQSYDNDTVNTEGADNCAASCTFHFDLKTEQIAFITKSRLGYKQFNKYFKILIEKHMEGYTFEIFLETNIDELKEKINKLSKIIEIGVTIIPPNASTDDFKNLFGATSEEIAESKATRYTQKLEIPTKNKEGLNHNGAFLNRMMYGVGKGYGQMVVKGKDKDNTTVTITSDEDAPYKETIPDKEKDNIMAFAEKAKNYIVNLVQKKNLLKIKEVETSGEVEQKNAKGDER